MKKVLLAVVLAALVASGCSRAGIGADASAILAPEVAQVRAAAEAGNRSQAAQALAKLKASVGELVKTGKLSDAQAQAVLDAATQVEANLVAIPVKQAPPLRRQPQPSPQPSLGPTPTPPEVITPSTTAPEPSVAPSTSETNPPSDAGTGETPADGGQGNLQGN
jgi:hypothetical protein